MLAGEQHGFHWLDGHFVTQRDLGVGLSLLALTITLYAIHN